MNPTVHPASKSNDGSDHCSDELVGIAGQRERKAEDILGQDGDALFPILPLAPLVVREWNEAPRLVN